jgi:hypothetical protein
MSQRTVGPVQRPAQLTRLVGATQAGSEATRRPTGRGSRQPPAKDWRPLLRSAWQVAAPGASRLRMTTRGAMVGMFAICLAATLLASVLHLAVLMGLGFCTACVLAPAYATRQALLEVVTAPPVTFLLAVIIVQALTAQGDSTHASILSVLEGTLLTLAAVAPWLLAGTVLCVAISLRRGLAQCVRDLSAGERGETGAGPVRG